MPHVYSVCPDIAWGYWGSCHYGSETTRLIGKTRGTGKLEKCCQLWWPVASRLLENEKKFCLKDFCGFLCKNVEFQMHAILELYCELILSSFPHFFDDLIMFNKCIIDEYFQNYKWEELALWKLQYYILSLYITSLSQRVKCTLHRLHTRVNWNVFFVCVVSIIKVKVYCITNIKASIWLEKQWPFSWTPLSSYVIHNDAQIKSCPFCHDLSVILKSLCSPHIPLSFHFPSSCISLVLLSSGNLCFILTRLDKHFFHSSHCHTDTLPFPCLCPAHPSLLSLLPFPPVIPQCLNITFASTQTPTPLSAPLFTWTRVSQHHTALLDLSTQQNVFSLTLIW